MCHDCPEGAACYDGAIVVPGEGCWHSHPRSTLMHACPMRAGCARDAAQQQALVAFQTHLLNTSDVIMTDVQQYSQLQCAEGYTGTLCSVCLTNSSVTYGRMRLSCRKCDDFNIELGRYIACRLFDIVLLCLLILLNMLVTRRRRHLLTLRAAAVARLTQEDPAQAAAFRQQLQLQGYGVPNAYQHSFSTPATATTSNGDRPLVLLLQKADRFCQRAGHAVCGLLQRERGGIGGSTSIGADGKLEAVADAPEAVAHGATLQHSQPNTTTVATVAESNDVLDASRAADANRLDVATTRSTTCIPPTSTTDSFTQTQQRGRSPQVIKPSTLSSTEIREEQQHHVSKQTASNMKSFAKSSSVTAAGRPLGLEALRVYAEVSG